jgi:peptidoglycan/LPS O-acetylase OafA/YrhL
MAGNLSRDNNFDLVRLFAALQVVLFHGYEHLHLPSQLLNSVVYSLRFFPGVPIFFAISGFLVFATYDYNPDLKNYFRNRFLRIYPGLWACLLITIGILSAFGYINFATVFSKQFWLWIVTQASFLQFYTPVILRHFGVGNPNGALWTIPVEISFYIFIPFIFWLFKRIRISRNAWILIWMAMSVAYNIYYQPYKFQAERPDLVKLMGVTIGPYLFYFLLGSLAYTNWDKIRKWYEGKGLLWLAIYGIYCIVFCIWLQKFHTGYWTNFYHFISVFLLSQTVLSVAYTKRGLSNRILKKNDLSFGLYIYHMPVINLLLALGYEGNNFSIAIVIIITTALAYVSWRFVERPALLLKKRTIN